MPSKPTITNERLMAQLGKERYRSRVRDAREHGRETMTVAGRYLLKESVAQVQAAVEAWRAKAEVGDGGGFAFAAYPYISQLPPEVTALIAVKVCLDGIAQERTYTSCANLIGTMLEDEARFLKFEAAFPPQSKQVLQKYKEAGYRKLRKEVRKLGDKMGVDWAPWSHKAKVRTGILLLEMIRQHTGTIEVVTKREYNGHQTNYILATKETLEWLEASHEAHETLFPFYLPTREVPNDWENLDDGGYHTDILVKRPLVKTSDKVGRVRAEQAAMEAVYSAVNCLQRTAWEVNPRVLEVVTHLWQSGAVVADLPSREDEKVPPKPKNFAALPEAEKKEYGRSARMMYDRNRAARSLRVMVAKTKFMADQFVGNPFYYVHQLDFRGRIYPVPFFLQPQGPSLARGLLQFAEGCEIKGDDHEAFDWWCIHGANSYGADKVPFEERIRWVRDAATEIRDCGERPLDNLWWTKADRPWEFLAFCLEYAAWSKSYRLHTKLPIQMDGSNNGLQIYSLLLRDEVGGKATNCIPSTTPQDIYQQVADRVTARLHASEEPFAKQWRSFLVGGRVPRSACKRPVMTLPYGSTRFSAHKYVMDWFMDYRTGKPESPWPVDFYTPCHWLSKQIWECIDEVVVAARAGMKWLQNVARACHDEKKALEWTAPSGFVVRQAYNEYRRSRIKTHYGAVVSKVWVREQKAGTLSRRQQVNGIAPNFVHSLDAAALVRTVNLCHERGVENFMMIHDSFGCLASDAPLMAEMTRRAYVEIFQEPVLERFRDEIQRGLKKELPPMPAMGTLDVGELMSSKYFFA